MGSYIPDGNLYTTYYNEMATGVGWVHYTLDGYHNTAREMATSMALNINRALNPPEWTLLEPPSNIRAIKKTNGDVVFTWDARPGAPGWTFRNKHAGTNAVIQEGNLTAPTWTFTYAMQVAAYGYGSNFVTIEVAEKNLVSGLTGAYSLFTGETTPE